MPIVADGKGMVKLFCKQIVHFQVANFLFPNGFSCAPWRLWTSDMFYLLVVALHTYTMPITATVNITHFLRLKAGTLAAIQRLEPKVKATAPWRQKC